MTKNNRLKKLLSLIIILGLMLQVTSCGTLLYPERRGQASGRLDPAVAIMDGIGVFFFVIPGLIAFAVDFYTGAIYLPGGSSQIHPTSSSTKSLVVLHENPNNLNRMRIENVVNSYTGLSISLDHTDIRISELDHQGNIGSEIAKAMNSNSQFQ